MSAAGPETVVKTRIMLVDDHASFRQPLAFVLDREPDLTVVAQAGSVAEGRAVLENGAAVDLAVVDLDLPDGPGSEFIAALRTARPRSPALVLSAHDDRARLARAVDAGAAGILHKSSRTEDILDAIRRLWDGEQLVSPDEVVDAVRLVGRERLRYYETWFLIEKLTAREREILQALSEGLSDKKIAERLYVSEGTVRSHMTRILSKLGMHSRLQVLIFAVRHSLVKID